MAIAWASLFAVAVIVFWFLNLIGMPGNWLIAAASAFYAWLFPSEARTSVSWPTVGIVVGLAVLGEIAEFAASAAGVRKLGGSWPGTIFALMGSIVGSVTGIFAGFPMPVIGSLVAAIAFGGLGALAGAMLGEVAHGKSLDISLKIGKAAF